jgi:hypothetical protein
MTLDIRGFHTDFVVVNKVPNHDKWKEYFVTNIDKELDSTIPVVKKGKMAEHTVHSSYVWDLKQNAKTSYYHAETIVDFNKFHDEVVMPQVDELIEKLDLNKYKFLGEHHIWYQRFDQMGRHDPHTHPDSHLCFIYLLHVDEPNNTIFYNSNTKHSPMFKSQMFTEDVPEGSIMFFPGHLVHEVFPTEKRRYTIAGNLGLEY